MTGPPDHRLPLGLVVRLDHRVRWTDGGRTLVGGSPGRLARLKPAVADTLRHTGRLAVTDPGSAELARYLLDAGLAQPLSAPPSAVPAADQVTVVIPVRDRPAQLARLLAALPRDLPVVVVDDGSARPAGTDLAAGARVTVIRHPSRRGPAAARNTGLAAVGTPLVAFLDSDVLPRPGWLEPLLAELADPAVALTAPRIVGLEPADGTRPGWIARYEAVASSLDLGPHPDLVLPRGRVAYLPSAAVLARTRALTGLDLAGFDESLPVGEDVDLVWRLHAAGWRVRYQPSSRVAHDHRTAVAAWLGRKARYGTSAAPLAARHPGLVPPLVAPGWAGAVWALLLVQRRWSAVAAVAVTAAGTARLAARLRSPERGRAAATRLAAGTVAPLALGSTGLQLAVALRRHWWPAAGLAAAGSRRARRALVAALLADLLTDRLTGRRRAGSGLDPVRFAVAGRLDDLAYGAGLWAGAWRQRSADPLLPRRPDRAIAPNDSN